MTSLPHGPGRSGASEKGRLLFAGIQIFGELEAWHQNTVIGCSEESYTVDLALWLWYILVSTLPYIVILKNIHHYFMGQTNTWMIFVNIAFKYPTVEWIFKRAPLEPLFIHLYNF